MMNLLASVFIPGNPKALKRHRQRKKGGTYDPSKGDKADFLALCMQARPNTPWVVPLHVEFMFVFDRPKSHYRTGKHSNQLRGDAPRFHTSNTDLSNLVKFVEDALNGIFWRDDKFIASTSCRKIWSVKPGIGFKVWEAETLSHG